MPLETATYIYGLVATNPDGGDARSTLDDHCRLIKAALKRTFPNLDGEVSVSADAINNAVVYGIRTNAVATISSTHIFTARPQIITGSATYAVGGQYGMYVDTSGTMMTSSISGWLVTNPSLGEYRVFHPLGRNNINERLAAVATPVASNRVAYVEAASFSTYVTVRMTTWDASAGSTTAAAGGFTLQMVTW